MEKLIYHNPIINSDYSDPDVIRVNDDFFMLASSFNHTPGVPVLHSKNLVDWQIINYVFEEIPFSRFKDVIHDNGAWAPAIRYHNNLFYAIIPFPDDGIYISTTTDPFGKWSDLWCLIEGKGIIDPCPIWTNDKCYIAVGFALSRIGFNSCIGLYEVSCDLKTQFTDYKIIYDGHNDNPIIEGPKFNERNGYYYIMAPAGSVKTGWQVCLRSKEIYGPYEAKVVLMQGDSNTNGPHQGALIDIDDNDNWAFIHFQDKKCYGRVVHLQPVQWVNDWPLCGRVKYNDIAGNPYDSYEYLINIKSDFKIPTNDDFSGERLSLIWQTPANKVNGWYELNNGLKLNCYYHDEESKLALKKTPNIFMQKIIYMSFEVETKAELSLTNDDEVGLCLMGSEYGYISICKKDNKQYLRLKKGNKTDDIDNILLEEEYDEKEIIFNLKYKAPNLYELGYNGKYFKEIFTAYPGNWVGSKVGIFAKGLENSNGYVKYKYFKMKESK